MKWTYNDGGRRAAGFTAKRMGDCVCRAISIATQRPYAEIFAELKAHCDDEKTRHDRIGRQAKLGGGSHPARGMHKPTYKRYLRSLGWQWHPTMTIGSGCHVHLRKSELPDGRLLVATSKHLVAVIDGVINDTHDPSRGGTRCVYGYWTGGKRMLQKGQVIRYGPALYRVDYVNECRAYIIPLTKRQVELADHSFEANGKGISIAANSYVEVVEDLQRAKDEMELAAAEAELAAAKAELARRATPSVTPVTTPLNTPPAAQLPKPKPHLRIAVKPGGGWHVAAEPPAFKDGTLAADVWTIISTYPGLPTSEIVATAEKVGLKGAIAACVSRFHQAGLIEKR